MLTSDWSSDVCSSDLFPGGASRKEPACQCRRRKRHGFDPWVGKIPWRRAWKPTPVLFPGKSHGQRSLAGCSPWGCEESDTTDTTERLHFHFSLSCIGEGNGNPFSRQEYWSGSPCPPPGDLSHPGIKLTSRMSPALAGEFFTTHTSTLSC